MIRLYFNRREDPEGCWSVDEGPGTPERKTNEVSVVGAFGVTKVDFTKQGPDEVSAWVEFSNAKVSSTGSRLFIYYDPEAN